MTTTEIINKLKEEKNYLNNSTVNELDKGWSNDKKYIFTSDSGRYLLTIFELKHYDNKLYQFDILKKMITLGVPVQEPVEIFSDSTFGYMVVSYIDGLDAEESLKSMSEEGQYNIGIQAGRKLKLMHQLKASDQLDSWYNRKKHKHAKYLETYKQLGIKLRNEQKIVNFINGNIELMMDRPNIFQHDDFHVGNIILDNKKIAGVIDFDLMDWGDPIHDFVKLGTVSRKTSIPFCIGQIHGYFGNTEPDEFFWKLYSLYHCMAAISTIVWVQRFHPSRVDEAMQGVNEMMEDHNYFDDIKPKWYKNIDM
ncbi:aminoglycoside phosphotransferase family protein [Alkalicella caledoniensis]|uniref:Aminoglycoside phosphotransferase family protein n=1 Tax=Alkalicella caledoniensis TaxID=2731377 RepID=A0A7G9W8P2_ALKCA|nr:aminoglycoside phosphotransferase family protein [Alkalicella caledoniensis]QNO15054.1 aminoglycoside phosphotransferase family protein [Alkalicella caledoniensis]